MGRILLEFFWEKRDPTRGDDAARLSRFISALPEFDLVYSSWLRSPKTKKVVVRVPLDEAEAEALVRDNIAKYDDGTPWPEFGLWIQAGHAGPPPYDFEEQTVAFSRFNIKKSGVTADKYPNHFAMDLARIRSSTRLPWRASELRPLMAFAWEVWRPAQMCARFSFQTFPQIADPTWAAGVRALQPVIGWITYLPPDLAARAKYPADVEVEVERLADGAALVTLCEEPFDKDDEAGLSKLRALEAALRPIQS